MENWSDQSRSAGGNPLSRFESGERPAGRSAERSRTRRKALLDAACVAVCTHGRARTRVADVIAAAGVSRNAFYREFAGVEQCVELALAQFDTRVRQVLDRALSDTGTPAARRFDRAIADLVRLAPREPDAFRAWMIDDFAKPSGRERVADLRSRLEPAAADALSAGGDPLPEAMVNAIVGGVVLTLQIRAVEGDVTSLPALLPELLGWALSYRPPARPLPAAASATDPSPGRDSPPDPADAAARIQLAITELVAERGYAGVRVKDVASRAQVSLRTFYGHFDGLEQAFLSTVERHERRLLRAAFRSYRDQSSWPLAVDASLRVLCAGLAGDPAVARVSGLGAHAGGLSTRDRPVETVTALQAFLRAGYRHHPDTRRFASEGVAAALAFTFHEHARSGRPELIRAFAPTATFLALSPFIPIAEATRIARHAA